MRYDEFVATLESELRAAFLAAVANIVDDALLADLIAAIEANNVEAAMVALAIDNASMAPVLDAVQSTFKKGGELAASRVPKRIPKRGGGLTVYKFDVRDTAAETWIKDESSKLVTRVNEETRSILQERMQERMIKGTNPRTTALDLVGRIDPATKRRAGGVVGLTQPQAKAVSKMKDELAELDPNYFTRQRRDKRFDSIVQKSIDTGVPLDAKTSAKIANRYSDSLLQLRGETIARTETLAALNTSDYQATQQAVKVGNVEESAVQRIWDSAGGGRVRDTHRTMDGQTVGLNEAFTTPGGAKLMHPGDSSMGAPGSEVINCRCRVRLKIDWLAGLI